ncbi:MAG: flagellin lysine-N-methylase, partial [Clostridia bacterium]|nr:flagellin lysine-N-methylase [Clostridia bacterium]
MKEAVPNYYHKFKCIQDKCKHNCCIGWEIDIDDDTLMLYESLDTPLGEKIRSNITGDVPHFKLAAGERCPFLMDSGLCEIIAEYGEDAICDICYLHPRFKNFYSDFTETG